jgi:dolichyl-phosphate beta-glucosyltransferase
MREADQRSGQDTGYTCTLVIPTFNAVDFIASTVERLRTFLNDNPTWCALFVCDGCPYGSAQKLLELTRDDFPQIQLKSYEQNRGKGYALRQGLNKASTPYVFYTDVDLAYDPVEALRVLKLLQDGADLAVVNRANPDSRFIISPSEFPRIYKRHLMSRGFNWLLRHMLPITILDTQAGLKGLTKKAWDMIGPQMTSEGFFFDVELLALAGALKLSVAETAVKVTYIDPTTIKMVSHGGSMILDTVRLRHRLRKARRKVDVHIRQLPVAVPRVAPPSHGPVPPIAR